MINVVNQVVTDQYAIYEGDCIEVIQSIPDNSIGFGIYSPPFVGLYRFSNAAVNDHAFIMQLRDNA